MIDAMHDPVSGRREDLTMIDDDWLGCILGLLLLLIAGVYPSLFG